MKTSSDAAPGSTGGPAASHLVITVHGIRTFGQWQERLESLLRRTDKHVRVVNYKYGYFSVVAFLLPFLRWWVTRRFRQRLEEELARHPGARVDLVAHSFGTHLVGWGLRGIPKSRWPRIDTIILAGSVLKPGYRWDDLIHDGHVRRVINECGSRDGILVLNQIVVLFTGMAGRVGFHGMTGEALRNNYYRFGHSGYFLRGGAFYDDFMRERWLPLLTSPDTPEPADERKPGGFLAGLATFLLNNAEPIKLAAYAAILATPAMIYFRLYNLAEASRRETKHQLHVARLIEGFRSWDDRDLGHGRGLLREQRNDPEMAGWRDFAWYHLAMRHRACVAEFSAAPWGTPSALGFAPGGETLAVGTDTGAVLLGEIARGSKLQELQKPESDEPASPPPVRKPDPVFGPRPARPIRSLAFGPDGREVAAGNAQGVVRVWDRASGRLRAEFRRPPESPDPTGTLLPRASDAREVVFSPAAELLAVRYEDGVVMTWTLRPSPAKEPQELLGPVASINVRTLGSAGGPPALVSLHHDAGNGRTNVRVWQWSPFRERPDLAPPAAPGQANFLVPSPDANLVVMFRPQGSFAVWDRKAGRGREGGAVFKGEMHDAVFLGDGKTLRLLHGNGVVLDLDVSTGRRTDWPGLKVPGESDRVRALAPDGRRAAAADLGDVVRVWDLERGSVASGTTSLRGESAPQPAGRNWLTGVPWAMALTPDGTRLVTAWPRDDFVTRIDLWDTSTGRHQNFLGEGGASGLQALDVSTGGRAIAFDGGGGAVMLSQTLDGAPRPRRLGSLGGRLDYLKFSPDGALLLAGRTDNGGPILWELGTGRETRLPAPGRDCRAVAFAPDGRTVALGSSGGLVSLRQVAGPASSPARTLKAPGPGLACLAFSADGRTLAAGGPGVVWLWDVASGRPREPLHVGLKAVDRVAFAPGRSSTLLALESAGVVSLWDVSAGRRIVDLGGANLMGPLQFSNDGRALWSAWSYWRAATEAEADEALAVGEPAEPPAGR